MGSVYIKYTYEATSADSIGAQAKDEIMKLIIKLLAISCFVLAIPSAFAETYYVDQSHASANDNNDGTESLPWRTIQKAANTLVAGDTVIVKAGVYTELSSQAPGTDVTGLKPQNSGTSSAPIIYQANVGDQVIIDQSNQGVGFYIFGKSHITVKGFTIRNIKGRTDFSAGVMTASNASYITVEDNVIHDVDGVSGANVAGIRFDNTTFSTARNNLIHGVTVNGQSNQNASAITSFGMEDMLIENNTMYNAYNGVYHKRSSGGTGALIRNNIIHSVTRGLYYDVAGTGNEPHINQRVTQNILYNVDDAIHLDAGDASGINDGFHVWNNTVTANNTAIWIENVRNAHVYNNIVFGPMAKNAIRTGPANATIAELNYNNYYNAESFVVNIFTNDERRYTTLEAWQDNEDFDINSSVANPMFVNQEAKVYKLNGNSSLINAGKDNTTIGAFITGHEVIGYVARRPENPTDVVVQ